MSCRSCGHGFELFQSMRNAPHGDANPCPKCEKPTAAQDYRYKRIQFVPPPPATVVKVPKGSGRDDRRVRGQRNAVAVSSPREWTELCKVNDWTDVSGADPESWDATPSVPRETWVNTSGDAPPPPPDMNGAETYTHTYTTAGE